VTIPTPYQTGLLQGWVDSLLTAGNHLAVALSDLPAGWERWSEDEVLKRYAGKWQYDVWMAWKTAMNVSKERRREFPEDF